MQNRVPSRLGFLSPVPLERLFEAFRQELAALGHRDGHEVVIEPRSADGQYARFPALVAELVDLRMDVIAVVGAVSVRVVKQVTSTIPIVFTIVVDPVADELVASMQKPGGNATGVTTFDPTQAQKQLALLREAISGLKRVALLSDQGVRKGLTRANVEHARALGLETERIEIAGSAPDLEGALAAVRQAHADALLLLEEPVVVQHRKQIVELATRGRIPTLISPAWVDAGALIAYGTSLTDGMRRMATYADRILRGAKPADLPVEQASKYELAINLKTAKALGLTIPQSILLRADHVIE